MSFYNIYVVYKLPFLLLFLLLFFSKVAPLFNILLLFLSQVAPLFDVRGLAALLIVLKHHRSGKQIGTHFIQ